MAIAGKHNGALCGYETVTECTGPRRWLDSFPDEPLKEVHTVDMPITPATSCPTPHDGDETGPQAWSTTDPDVVDAYLAAQRVVSLYARRVNAEAVAFGGVLGAARARSSEGSTLIGLIPDGDDAPPPRGWRHSHKLRCLIPAVGTVGRDARRWIKENPGPPEPRSVLTANGLPPNDLTGRKARNGDIAIVTPTIGVHDRTVWALYEGQPGDWMSGPQTPGELWIRRPVSEFWAAAERRAAQLASAR